MHPGRHYQREGMIHLVTNTDLKNRKHPSINSALQAMNAERACRYADEGGQSAEDKEDTFHVIPIKCNDQ